MSHKFTPWHRIELYSIFNAFRVRRGHWLAPIKGGRTTAHWGDESAIRWRNERAEHVFAISVWMEFPEDLVLCSNLVNNREYGMCVDGNSDWLSNPATRWLEVRCVTRFNSAYSRFPALHKSPNKKQSSDLLSNESGSLRMATLCNYRYLYGKPLMWAKGGHSNSLMLKCFTGSSFYKRRRYSLNITQRLRDAYITR